MITVDMRCDCGHSPESHNAGYGQCYSCDAEKRCPGWKPKTIDAHKARIGLDPWEDLVFKKDD